MTNVESIDTSVDLELAQSALSLAERRQKWEAMKDFYLPIIRALQRLGTEPKLSGDIDVSFAGDSHKFSAVVRVLRTNGFTTKQPAPKAGQAEWHGYYANPKVDTKVWLYFTSSVCRRIKIGTKMVEQDVYETVCGEIGVEESA